MEVYMVNKSSSGLGVPDSVNIDGKSTPHSEYLEMEAKQNENSVRNDNGSSEA